MNPTGQRGEHCERFVQVALSGCRPSAYRAHTAGGRAAGRAPCLALQRQMGQVWRDKETEMTSQDLVMCSCCIQGGDRCDGHPERVPADTAQRPQSVSFGSEGRDVGSREEALRSPAMDSKGQAGPNGGFSPEEGEGQ